MTRLTRRAAATTGLSTLATVTLGLAFAPAALAAPTGLAAPTAPSSVVAGQAFTVSGTGCVAEDPATYEALVVVVTDLSDLNANPPTGLFFAEPSPDGAWSTQVTLPAGTTGSHPVWASCDYAYLPDPVDYPEITVSVSTPVTDTPAPENDAPKTDASKTDAPATPTTPSRIRGVSANTSGVVAQTTGATTKDSAPGRKVVKVYKGFQPFEVVKLTMHSTPQVLGTFRADSAGVLTVEFTVPAGTPTGAHTLVLEGPTTYFQEAFQVTGTLTTAGSLASTGADVGLPLALGAGLLVAGGGVLVATRRRPGAAQA